MRIPKKWSELSPLICIIIPTPSCFIIWDIYPILSGVTSYNKFILFYEKISMDAKHNVPSKNYTKDICYCS